MSRMPKSMIRSEALVVRNWKMRSDSQTTETPIRCPQCKQRHTAGAAYCRICGSRIYLEYLRRGRVGQDLSPNLAAWLLLVVLAVAIPTLATSVPRSFAMPIIVLLVCIGMFVGIRTFGKLLHSER